MIMDLLFAESEKNLILQKELKNTPLRKLVQPIDILNSCDFLLSDKNNLISGEEIFITGGKI